MRAEEVLSSRENGKKMYAAEAAEMLDVSMSYTPYFCDKGKAEMV